MALSQERVGITRECTAYGSMKEFQILYFLVELQILLFRLIKIFDKIIKISISF